MIKINLIKLKSNKGFVPYEAEGFRSGFPGSETLRRSDSSWSMLRKSQSSTTGFVILFAITIASLVLAIALGVANIALKEIKFSTSAQDTNEAFFAADTGIEYMLFEEKSSPHVLASGEDSKTWSPVFISGIGTTGKGCAIVTITKNNLVPPLITTIVSKGYNVGDSGTCDSSDLNRIEREIKVSY